MRRTQHKSLAKKYENVFAAAMAISLMAAFDVDYHK